MFMILKNLNGVPVVFPIQRRNINIFFDPKQTVKIVFLLNIKFLNASKLSRKHDLASYYMDESKKETLMTGC